MLHRVSGKKLGRTSNQRKALFNNLARSLFLHGAIETTQAKAKAVIAQVEKMANLAMKGDLSARRELFKSLQSQKMVNAIVTQMQSVFGEQKSNFTLLQNVKRRMGDDALIVRLSLSKPFKLNLENKKEEVKKETKVAKVAKKVKKSPAKS